MFNLMDYNFNLERIDYQNKLVSDMAQVFYGDDSHIGHYELAERLMII